jgi:predicted RND superfamily exporter protein
MELFPKNHPYVKTHKEFAEYFGGANVATLVLEVKEGDIYNIKTLEKIVRIQEAVDRIPGVNPFQVFSLASRRVQRTEAIAGGIAMTPIMRDVPTNNAEMFNLKAKVFSSEAFGNWVSTDLKALRLKATFIEDKLDHRVLFGEFIKIRQTEEDDNHKIFLAGEPILYGWVYSYVPEMSVIFGISCLILVILLFFFLGRQPAWWIPLMSAILSAIWGLGMSGFLGYQFDPLIIVVPFLLTARAMSHGVQWLNRFGHEFRRTGDVMESAHITGVHLFNPCVIGVVTDACGILIVALIPIPILQHLAILGFFWGMSVIFTVSLFNPVFVSFIPLKAGSYKENPHWTFLTNFMGGMARYSITKHGKVTLIIASIIILVAGITGYTKVPIGDANPGSPVLWPDSDYNKSVDRINQRFLGMEEMYVLVRLNPNTSEYLLNADSIKKMEELKNFLISRGEVASGITVGGMFSSMNSLARGSDPKYDLVPSTNELISGLLFIATNNAALGDMDKYYTPTLNAGNVRLFLRDHKGSTLKKVIQDIREWAARPENIVRAPSRGMGEDIQHVFFEPAGGLGGILAAAIELIEEANHYLVAGILFFTFLCCAVVYRSLFAGFIFVLSLVLANFVSFAYMAWKEIGLNINTVPVVSLGVGLGVDYGLYIVSQIKELIVAGASWEKGIIDGVSSTGRAVFYQAVMMSSSVFFWWFSPLRFQAEMGFLLAILMMVNMFVGVLLLPALIHMFKPKFISRDIQVAIPA